MRRAAAFRSSEMVQAYVELEGGAKVFSNISATERLQRRLRLVDPRGSIALGIGEASERLGAHHREELFLVLEVTVRGHRAHPELLRERAKRDSSVAILSEQAHRGIDQSLLPRKIVPCFRIPTVSSGLLD